jgi:transposase
MDVLIPRCCGLDVHQKTVMASVRILGPTGEVTRETRTFGTTTRELEGLAAWLRPFQITHVAMEATGVLWKPVWHILEPEWQLLLVNPQHLKRVPGRKSDVQDAAWIAQLLQCGLLHGSFVPPAAIRELRDLTRTRTTMEDEVTAVVNRIHKVLEDANLKLSTVASDIMGVSGRAMLQALVDGETDPVRLADLARRRLRTKRAALAEALYGRVTDHHRFLLRRFLTQVHFLEDEIATFDRRIAELTAPFAATLERLDQIPGINRRTAETVIAEVGPDMAAFRSAAALVSWAGVCPGKRESAGKSRQARLRKGNRWLTRAPLRSAGSPEAHPRSRQAIDGREDAVGDRHHRPFLAALPRDAAEQEIRRSRKQDSGHQVMQHQCPPDLLVSCLPPDLLVSCLPPDLLVSCLLLALLAS